MKKKTASKSQKPKTKKKKNTGSSAMFSSASERRRYEAEDAARTLVRAAEIKQNPRLMSAVMKQIEKQKKALSSITKKS